MPKQDSESKPPRHQPGPGLSTSEDAFNELRRDIARRNDRAQQEGAKVRAKREREQMRRRRERDL